MWYCIYYILPAKACCHIGGAFGRLNKAVFDIVIITYLFLWKHIVIITLLFHWKHIVIITLLFLWKVFIIFFDIVIITFLFL